MGEKVPEGTHETKNGRICRFFTDVALVDLGPSINGCLVNLLGVGDELVRLPRDSNSDSQQGGAAGGLSCWQRLHMVRGACTASLAVRKVFT